MDSSPVDDGAVGGQSSTATRQLYDAINTQLDASARRKHSIFLNFGYVPSEGSDDRAQVDAGAYLINQNPARLVFETIGDWDLGGRTVLDVGCGRGGTAFLMNRHFDPELVCGADLSWQAVAFCRRRYRSEHLLFVEADAQRLPFGDGAFDVVSNIESSHCYPDLAAFYTGVARVLKPGGRFLYADVMDTERFDRGRELIEEAGLEIELDRDVTENVLLSRNEEGQRHLRAFQVGRGGGPMGEFLGLPGSKVYARMDGGRAWYRILRAGKPG
jgi:phthiocerol/phenolphthiocerol synthesis type-I polyketide synthase E